MKCRGSVKEVREKKITMKEGRKRKGAKKKERKGTKGKLDKNC